MNVPSTKLLLVARFQSQEDILSTIKQRTKFHHVPSYKTEMSDHTCLRNLHKLYQVPHILDFKYFILCFPFCSNNLPHGNATLCHQIMQLPKGKNLIKQ
jgi:hypothetical protein